MKISSADIFLSGGFIVAILFQAIKIAIRPPKPPKEEKKQPELFDDF